MSKNKADARETSDPDPAAVPMVGWLEPPQPQELVLTLLADNVRHRLTSVWSGGLVRLLGGFGFSTAASRVALARLAQRDLISRMKNGRKVAYQLTARAERLMAEGDRRIFNLGRQELTDGRFTVLWHTLPEDRRLERGRLARRLRFLGFGSFQDATWISPGDREDEIVSLVNELGVEEFTSVLTGTPSAAFGIQQLMERGWDLTALSQRYAAFVAQFSPYGQAQACRDLDDRTAFRVRTQVIHNFRQFPALDPGLPTALATGATDRSTAIELFHTIYPTLAEQAHRHFDELTKVDGTFVEP